MFSLGKPSKAKFASQLMRALQQQEPSSRYEFDAEKFRLVRQDENGEVNLTNVYQEHCALPSSERKHHLIRLSLIFGVPQDRELAEDFETAKSHLRPKVYNRSTFAFMELQQRMKGEEMDLDIPLYPLGSHLFSSLAYDTEHTIRSISNEDLEGWNVTYYEALEIACQNLDEASMAYSRIGDGFHSSISGDNYDSARILLLDRIRSMEVVGETIGLVPQRDAMYVAGSEDNVSLDIMFDLAAKTIADEARPMCPIPMKLDDDEWVDWEPPQNHAVRGKFEELKLNFLGGLYHEQKELLDALLDAGEEIPFVASFSAIQTEESDAPLSYCVWGRGVDSLLPETQFIVFVDESGMLASGTWAHVASVVSDLLVQDDSYYPARYRAQEFPSEEQFASIGTIEPFDG